MKFENLFINIDLLSCNNVVFKKTPVWEHNLKFTTIDKKKLGREYSNHFQNIDFTLLVV